MSKKYFLNELKRQRGNLKETETIVTEADGHRFVESKTGSNVTKLEPHNYGFILDTNPDDIPAEIVDHLFIGSQDCAVPTVLEKYNIQHVLSVGIEENIKDVNYKFVPCLDLPETDVKPILKEALPFIKHAVDKKENVLIHCNAGVSRTSMVAIGYLMLCRDMEFENAYNLLKNKRPAIRPNDGFQKQLRNLKDLDN